MLNKYIVKRKDYDTDVGNLRKQVSELNKQLREQENLKAQAKAETKAVKKAMQGLSSEVGQLNKKLQTKVYERDLKEYMDPIPEGETPRAQHMAQIAGMFEGGMRDKLNYMHSQFKNQTGMFPLTERETDFFRSCINVVGLLLDWGEECVNEHHSNIANANNMGTENIFDSDEKEAVENIKSKLKQ